MSAAPYIDTSALAKWYLNEPRSEDFAAFITTLPSAAISRLTVVEFRCLLARRRRSGGVTEPIERRVLDALHLAIARDIGAPLIATADLTMANAAAALGLDVARFD